tara:strand:+ start:2140 stop:2694 length:555 start_codon:yes stop_codon:yes gene_type:complete
MAITKGVNATAIDTDDPFNFLAPGNVGGNVHVSMDSRACAAGDLNADGDAVILCQVPSNARIISILLINDDLDSGTTSAINIGVYNGNEQFNDTDGSQTLYAADAIIDEDAFAEVATDLRIFNSGTEVGFRTAARKNAPLQSVWEDAGLTSDPGVPLRIALTQTATVSGAQAGDVVMVVQYITD